MSHIPQLRWSVQNATRLLITGVLLFSFSTQAQAPLDVRVALVIGNAAYRNIPALANPTKDAQSMATVLRKLGFKVVEVVDGDKAQMVNAIAQMQTLLQGQQAVGMLYYAGHGLQLDWRNYMVPVDAKLSQASDVASQTVDIENVIATMKRSATRMNIIVLDACRDNPFSGKAGGKGLAQLDAPPGTYLAFATAPGNVAEDGDEVSGNGLFTQYLLKELQRPARIEDLFKRVRLQVRQKSQGRQIPWDSSSLEDDFAFNDGLKYTFNPEDLIKEAQQAKEAQAQLQRAAQAAAEREKQIAQQIALEQQLQAEALKIQNLNARLKAESEAKERERQLALAAEQERQKAMAAALALERAQAEEAQRIKNMALAKAQAAEEARRKTLSREEAQAQQFAQEKAAWDKIKDSGNKADVYSFILQFPSGMLSELASTKLDVLDKAQIKPQADQLGRIQEFAPRRFSHGDFFEFLGKDGFTGLAKWQQTFTVLSVDDEGAEVQGTRTGSAPWKQRVSHAGLQSSDNSGQYDPPITFMPAGVIQVGYKWRARTQFTPARNNTQEWLEIAAKVVSRETIEVPAGKFDTFKIEVAMQYQSGHRSKLTIWTDPAIGVGIRIISESRPVRGTPDITIRELTSVKRMK